MFLRKRKCTEGKEEILQWRHGLDKCIWTNSVLKPSPCVVLLHHKVNPEEFTNKYILTRKGIILF